MNFDCKNVAVEEKINFEVVVTISIKDKYFLICLDLISLFKTVVHMSAVKLQHR